MVYNESQVSLRSDVRAGVVCTQGGARAETKIGKPGRGELAERVLFIH